MTAYDNSDDFGVEVGEPFAYGGAVKTMYRPYVWGRNDFAQLGHPEVSFAFLAGWFWFHELAHTSLASPALRAAQATSCTGALVQAQDGTLWHGRNMDQSPHQVRNCTLRVTFVNGSSAVLFLSFPVAARRCAEKAS